MEGRNCCLGRISQNWALFLDNIQCLFLLFNDTINNFERYLTCKCSYFGKHSKTINIPWPKIAFLQFYHYTFKNMFIYKLNVLQNCWLCHYLPLQRQRNWIFTVQVFNLDFLSGDNKSFVPFECNPWWLATPDDWQSETFSVSFLGLKLNISCWWSFASCFTVIRSTVYIMYQLLFNFKHTKHYYVLYRWSSQFGEIGKFFKQNENLTIV